VTKREKNYEIQSPRRVSPKLSYETIHSIGFHRMSRSSGAVWITGIPKEFLRIHQSYIFAPVVAFGTED
jgi:hypothetical protein